MIVESRHNADKQLQLNELLRELGGESLDSAKIEQCTQKIVKIYEVNNSLQSEFRHSYSEILTVMYGGIPPKGADDYEECTTRAQMLSSNLARFIRG